MYLTSIVATVALVAVVSAVLYTTFELDFVVVELVVVELVEVVVVVEFLSFVVQQTCFLPSLFSLVLHRL
jgi:hypothetical protein